MIDMIVVAKMTFKMRSYSLNAVSEEKLSERKDDVDHTMIAVLWRESAQGRSILCDYCLKDAILVERLMDKLCIVPQYAEMARVCGVPLGYLIQKGQQIKVVAQLLPLAHQQGYLMPYVPVCPSTDKYEGAIVVEPKRGFYDVPIVTLDYNSLYPSIMICYNLCYTTYLQSDAYAQSLGLVRDVDYKESPVGHLFVTGKKKQGILTSILQSLLANRKIAKNALFAAEKRRDELKELLIKHDPCDNNNDRLKVEDELKAVMLHASVMDGRQNALKVSANSVYGFTGATVGKLPLLQISSSVTGYGRQMIGKTISVVEEHFTGAVMRDTYGIGDGSVDTSVIYGDTDSVMIKFGGVKSVADAMELGKKGAALVNTYFDKPINLDFEKVFYPYLLINKKRYIGGYWTRPDAPDRTDAKGVESVRRDNCLMVSNMLKKVSDILMREMDPNKAVQHVIDTLAMLKRGKMPIEHLIISKGFAKEEYKGIQPHVEVVKKMRRRCLASAPFLGDRVPYIICAGTKDQKSSERAEDPLHVIETGMPIDYNYYIDNQLRKPLTRFFGPVLAGKKTDDEMERAVNTRIFNHPSLQFVVDRNTLAANETVGIAKFCVRVPSCVMCRHAFSNENVRGQHEICSVCAEDDVKVATFMLSKRAEHDAAEAEHARLRQECLDCKKGDERRIDLCSNRDCPIFYKRFIARAEYTNAQELRKRIEW